LGKPNTIYYVKVPEQKDHVSLAKVKFRETEVLFLNDRPVRDKKAII
jgi:hypothetical protein